MVVPGVEARRTPIWDMLPRFLAWALLTVAGAVAVAGGTAAAAGDPSVLFREDFERGLGDPWLERGFPSIARKNTFSVAVEPDGNHYLRVDSADSYSAKGVYLTFAVGHCPVLEWRWRVSAVITPADITRKDGDDAAAKVYIVFASPSWWSPLDHRVLLYLWDNATPVGALLPNAWAPKRERMIVLESGPAHAGQWVSERVDLARDFARAFPGETPSAVEGIAVLADTDNTHTRVRAGFDDLVVRCSTDAPPVAR